MRHPHLCQRSCADCKTWWYRDTKSNEIVKRKGEKLKRPPGSKTPCDDCPKESPEKEHLHILNRRSLKAVEIYWMVQSTGITDELREKYPRLVQDLSVIHQLIGQHKEDYQSELMMTAIAGAQING